MIRMTAWRKICTWLQHAYCILVAVTLLVTALGWALVYGLDNQKVKVKSPVSMTRNIRYWKAASRPVVDGERLYLKVGTAIKAYTTEGEYLHTVLLPETKGGSEVFAEDGLLYIERYGDVYVLCEGALIETLTEDEADAVYEGLKKRSANGNTDANGAAYTNVGDDIVRTDSEGNTAIIVEGSTYARTYDWVLGMTAYATVLSVLMIFKAKLGFQPLSRWT